MKYGLNDEVIECICSVFSQYTQVRRAILYGSRAKGNYKKGSDIDLTLEGDQMLTLEILNRISNELDDLLLPYTIDLSIMKHISNPDFLKHIKRVGINFYDSNCAKISEHGKRK